MNPKIQVYHSYLVITVACTLTNSRSEITWSCLRPSFTSLWNSAARIHDTRQCSMSYMMLHNSSYLLLSSVIFLYFLAHFFILPFYLCVSPCISLSLCLYLLSFIIFSWFLFENKKIRYHFSYVKNVWSSTSVHRHTEGSIFTLGKVKVKLSLCLTKHHAMKTYGEVDV